MHKIFVATCQAQDEEMRDRIERHQQERGAEWRTVEEPVHLSETIAEQDGMKTLVLVDCLTLWISNLLMQEATAAEIQERCVRLENTLASCRGRVYLVSNEVGQGLVPEHPLGRVFRDQVGWLNQRMAAVADRVAWMVAGMPVLVKG